MVAGAVLVFGPNSSMATKGRWGVGGAVGLSDFMTSSEVRGETGPGPFLAGWVRRGLTERGEALVVLDDVQAKGKGSRSHARLRSVTMNWLQSYGQGIWTPYVTAGAGPSWVNNTGAHEPNRGSVAMRAGVGTERALGDSWGVGAGATYHYAFSNGRYVPSSSALGAHAALTYYFSCGSTPAPAPAATKAPAVPPPAVAMADADKDGVADARDTCPGTPVGATVDALGCPKDSDNDGVLDMTDACPDTPRGILVNDVGCPVKTVSVSLDLKFPTGKSELSAEFDPQLKKVADFMDRFPTVTLVIEGHTDNVGSAAKNKVLSQVRADSVKNALIKKFNVSADRVSSKGFGAESPVASNATAEGRAKNRRVVAVLSATE